MAKIGPSERLDQPQMYVIDDELKEFVESGVATVVGTVDGDGHPHIVFGWGSRCRGGSSIEVFVEEARSNRTMANIADNGRIALTLASPVSYRSIQFKGFVDESSAATPGDEPWIQKHRDAFIVELLLIGDPPEAARNLPMSGPLIRLRFDAQAAYDQTPGPEAGRQL
jgi:hypothetical protein